MERHSYFFVTILSAFIYMVSGGADHGSAGMVSLTFDDGIIGTYKYAFPILKKHHQVATVALIQSRLLSVNEDYMTIEQGLELQKQGWEIASHGLTHKRPIDIPKLYSNEALTGWTIEDKKRHIYQTTYEYTLISFLLEGDTKLKEVYAWEDLARETDSYYFDRILEELHVRPLLPPADAKQLDIKSCSYQREMEYSKIELERLGFFINTYVTPYNYWTDDLKGISRNYYKYVVTGFDSDNQPATYDSQCIRRFVVHKDDTVNSLIRLVLEHAVRNNAWVVLCLHEVGDGIGWEPWSAKRFERFSSWLQEQGIKVVTISEGAAIVQAVQRKATP